MRIAIIDCETTGLDNHDLPISIAVVVVAIDQKGCGAIVDEWYGEQEPTVSISDSAYAVHGRTLASLAGKAFDLESLSKTMAGCTVAIAHNATFDAAMIAKAWPGIRSLEWRCSLEQWPFPPMEGRSLDTACRFFGIQRNIPHDAMADAKALLEALNREREGFGETHLQSLLKLEPYVDASDSSETQKVEVIAAAFHARKLILSPPVDPSVRILRISWYDESSLACCEIGTSFSLTLLLNLIVAYHDGRSILEADGSSHDWLVNHLEAGEEIGLTIVDKEYGFFNFAVWKRLNTSAVV